MSTLGLVFASSAPHARPEYPDLTDHLESSGLGQSFARWRIAWTSRQVIRLMFGALAILTDSLALAQPAPNPAEWTVLVYMNGDNNLEKDALINFEQMARVGSTDQVNILVQFDRIAKYAHTSRVDWSQTLRFRVTRDMPAQPKQAVQDLGEQNMGDPKVLADFIKWEWTSIRQRNTS